MPRNKLVLPPLPFNTRLRVRITDINYGNHLGNDSIFGLIHEARIQFFAALNYFEGDIEGSAIVLSDAVVIFRAQGFLGDELEIGVGIGDVGRVECDMYYRIRRVTDDKVLAEAKTNIAFMDASRTTLCGIPPAFLERLAQFAATLNLRT